MSHTDTRALLWQMSRRVAGLLRRRAPRDPKPRRVLFITKFSTSPSTALGVQTRLLMKALPGSISLYWATPRHYPNSATSVRLESALIARAGRLQNDRSHGRLVRALRLSWWRSDSLRRSKRNRIERLRRRVSQVYMAPIDAQDAARMRQLAKALQRPFVLHLWDSFSGPVADDPNLVWLIRRAARVLIVSEPLEEEVRHLGARTERLLFSRSGSRYAAAAPDRGRGPIRIALLGSLDPYADGVVLLDRAVDMLAERGVDVQLVYVGSARGVAVANSRIRRPIEPTGFLPDEERDQVLASCHLGFLPGPAADPRADMRSRYSIPSRSTDFFAVGLPTVGTIHPRSAAARYYEDLGLARLVALPDAVALARAIEEVSDPGCWEEQHLVADAAWRTFEAGRPGELLNDVLRDLEG